MILSGWGRYPSLECRFETLRRIDDLPKLMQRAGTLIPRGNGRSYGDAALNTELTLSMLAMDRMLAFDAETGILTCESGVLLGDILNTFVPRGWFPPVVPGTKHVSVGGLIAADVHGKNHHRDGSFGTHVEALTLATADGDIRECSRDKYKDLFYATIGGMGLTGIILSARFRLRPVDSAFLMEQTLTARDLESTMTLIEESSNYPYSVAWIDSLAHGTKLGRGLVSRAKVADQCSLPAKLINDSLRTPSSETFGIPIDLPFALLNRASVKTFNTLYYQRGRASDSTRLTHFDSFFFPLDRITAWNRLYGRKGFVQYQCVLPKADSLAGITALLECAVSFSSGPFLAVLKLLGPSGAGMMSFPIEGYTLALDFPLRRDTFTQLRALDEITHHYGGRIYLAKDACSTPDMIRQGYPQSATFKTIRTEIAGSGPAFTSSLSHRLAL